MAGRAVLAHLSNGKTEAERCKVVLPRESQVKEKPCFVLPKMLWLSNPGKCGTLMGTLGIGCGIHSRDGYPLPSEGTGVWAG